MRSVDELLDGQVRIDDDLLPGVDDDDAGKSLLDVVDNLLNQGVVLHGDLILGVAGVDLVFAQLSVLLCAVDRIFPKEERAQLLLKEGEEP